MESRHLHWQPTWFIPLPLEVFSILFPLYLLPLSLAFISLFTSISFTYFINTKLLPSKINCASNCWHFSRCSHTSYPSLSFLGLENYFIWTEGNRCPGFREPSTKISLVVHYDKDFSKNHSTTAATKTWYIYKCNRHIPHGSQEVHPVKKSYFNIQVLTDLPPIQTTHRESMTHTKGYQTSSPAQEPHTTTLGVTFGKQIHWGNGLILH